MKRSIEEGALVDPRVLFAAERTLLAWIRTGLSLVGLGFVVARFGLFLREMAGTEVVRQSSPVSLWFGVALVVSGVLLNAVAIANHMKVVKRLRSGETAFPAELSPAIWFAAALGVLAVGVAFYLIGLRPPTQ